MACTYVHLTGILALQEAELTFSYKRCARVLTRWLPCPAWIGVVRLSSPLLRRWPCFSLPWSWRRWPCRGDQLVLASSTAEIRGCCATLGFVGYFASEPKAAADGRRERNDPQAAYLKRAEWFCHCHRRCGQNVPSASGYGVASRCRDYRHGPFSMGSPVSV